MHGTGIKHWWYGFTVMPQSGNVVMTATEKYGRRSLFMFSLKDGKLKETNKLCLPCPHKVAAYISPWISDGREQLVVSCALCFGIKLVNVQTGKWSIASWDHPYRLCSGDKGTIFVQSQGDKWIKQLDATSSEFKGPIRGLHTDIMCETMCYIPHPINALVLSDAFSSNMVALSVERDVVIWEFPGEKGGIHHYMKGGVHDRVGLLFHPEHNVLFVADGVRRRVLVLNPNNGDLIQTINLPELGEIWALGLYNNQLVMLHGNCVEEWKVSYFNV